MSRYKSDMVIAMCIICLLAPKANQTGLAECRCNITALSLSPALGADDTRPPVTKITRISQLAHCAPPSSEVKG